MARSARHILSAALAAGFILGLGFVLAACGSTTQQKAERLKVDSARLLAARKPVEVTTPAPGIEVVRAGAVRGPGRSAIAVTLRNTGNEPVNDLPLSLSMGSGGKRVEVNGKPISYSQVHAPALAPGETGTWVYVSKDALPGDGPVIARVGVPAGKPITTATEIPKLDVGEVTTTSGGKSATAEVEISNPGDIPQTTVVVHAWAERDGRFLAAGQAVVKEVGPGESETVSVRLVGDPGDTEVQIFAPATIFE